MPWASDVLLPLLGVGGVAVVEGVCVPEGVVDERGDLAGASGVMVDCDEEREKVLARGARCVSLSSAIC